MKDFQYLDDNKDQGINVREKAKSLVALLKDDERLRNERVRALKAKERFAQSAAGIGSDTVVSIFLHLRPYLVPLGYLLAKYRLDERRCGTRSMKIVPYFLGVGFELLLKWVEPRKDFFSI